MFARLFSRAIALPARLHNRQRRVPIGRLPRDQRHAGRSERGQSLVEFALVLPMLLVLLLGVADFGRVFAAGITLEAAARNGAEAAAQQYVQILRNKATLTADDYAALHQVALETVCAETSVLPNQVAAGSTCTMPATAVCIHDAAGASVGPDGGCGADVASAPAECGQVLPTAGWNAANAQGSLALGYVEVRTCYRFTTLFNLQNLQLPFAQGISVGDIYLQRTRIFSIACYYSACS